MCDDDCNGVLWQKRIVFIILGNNIVTGLQTSSSFNWIKACYAFHFPFEHSPSDDQ